MGNSHSALSQRKTEQSRSLHAQTSDSHADARRTPSSEGASNQPQSSGTSGGVREETMATDLAQSPATGKRKSLLNFASLRKQSPRPSVEMSDSHHQSEGNANSFPTSRHHRLWRSGLRGPSRPRPTSVFVPPTSTTPVRRPSSAILSAPPAPTPATKMKEKGKARDESVSAAPSDSATPATTYPGVGLYRLDEPPPVLDSDLPIAGEEMPLSEQVLNELRNLQQQQQQQEQQHQQHQQDEVPSVIKYDTKDDVNSPPELSGNSITPLNDKEKEGEEEVHSNRVLEAARAPTPVPVCPIAVQPASPSSSFTRLSDTLGSWMGGIGQSSETSSTALPNLDNNTEIVSVVPPISEPDVCSPSIPVSQPETSARTQTQSSNANANSNSNANTNANANTGARRPLPPTGTGTIVVVQGVVHTADVRQSQTDSHSSHHHRPPRNISSTPALRNLFPTLPSQTRSTTPQPTGSARNRFSSFTDTLRQRSRSRTPTSSTRNRNHNQNYHQNNNNNNTNTHSALEDYLGVQLGDDHDRDQSVLSLGLENPASDDSETSTSFTETTSSVGAVVSTDDTSTLASTLDPSADHVSRPRDDRAANSSLNGNSGGNNSNSASDDDTDGELSPGSIEVLGTLLSVATAATAASLVNGTTEPLFNPNLAGRLAEDSLNGSSRGGARQAPNNPSDRMRSAWDNFRDRFSRSRRRHMDGDPSTEVDDTREQMVREMARAFNLDLGGGSGGGVGGVGLGVGGGGGGANSGGGNGASGERELGSASSSDPHLAGSNSDAPEGSFEQFLHNLQVDLRTALAENYAARRAGGGGGGGERGAAAERREQQPNATSRTNQSDSTQSSSPAASNANVNSTQSPTQTAPTVSSAINPLEPSIGIPYHPRSPHSATIDLPPLPAAADTPNSNERDRRPQARAITGQPGAGINWWRLYRFPPMVMASSSPANSNTNTNTGDGNGAIPPASNLDPTGLETQPPLSHSQSSQLNAEGVAVHMSPESSERQADSSQERQAQPQPQTETQTQTQQQQQQQQQQQASDGSQQVVPVIVVGLQSVPVNRNSGSQPEEHQFGGEAELVAENPAEPTRGRSWPARAASSASRAFSRMGRRNEDGSTDQHHHRTNDNTEPRTHTGRTYLIFVIGGYYPPNHGIVTGADDMNSFEALWELAELIGQVKPQVASKEDIEQSGLEVFKASKLSEYEATHKVASNTTERCLICLDDYDSEDDIRLLTCTHAFHRNCVDRWLEQGKNNCPACRSKGVRTTDDPPVPLPSL